MSVTLSGSETIEGIELNVADLEKASRNALRYSWLKANWFNNVPDLDSYIDSSIDRDLGIWKLPPSQ